MRRLSLLVLVAFTVPILATEPNPSTQQRALIERLLALTRTDQAARAMTDAMFAQMERQLLEQAEARGDDPGAADEAREILRDFRTEAAKIEFGPLINEGFIRIYAKYFTESEIADLIAFYSTPTGQKSIDVMGDLMRDGMQLGVERIAPKFDEVMTRVRHDYEARRPWRRTMQDIRTVAIALETYVIDHGDKYPGTDYEGLEALLTPTYLRTLPKTDMWDHPYAYAVSADGNRYRLLSAAADGNFEWDSRRFPPLKDGEGEPVRYRDRLEDDLIFESGSFVQLPAQARPREH
jgi:hypothetical protein